VPSKNLTSISTYWRSTAGSKKGMPATTLLNLEGLKASSKELKISQSQILCALPLMYHYWGLIEISLQKIGLK
jgi:hypothetical protein